MRTKSRRDLLYGSLEGDEMAADRFSRFWSAPSVFVAIWSWTLIIRTKLEKTTCQNEGIRSIEIQHRDQFH